MYISILDKTSFIILFCYITVIAGYHVDVVDNGPIVRGGTIKFMATLYDENNNLASGDFRYVWEDTAVPIHSDEHKTQSPKDVWSVTYNATVYPAGRYVVQVTVSKYFMFLWSSVASCRVEFHINETLNGEILLIQRNETRTSVFVSNADQVIHNISLKQSDANFIKNAPTVLTYWFIDCVYYGVRRDFIFPFNYTEANEKHFVEALVVADFTPLPPPTTTTTTTPKPTTTTSKTTTTSSTTPSTTTTTKSATTAITTTTKHSASVRSNNSTIVKRDTQQAVSNQTSKIMVNINGTLQPYDGVFPFVCNSTQVVTDPKKIYGYFYKKINVKAPVSKVNVTGNNWLQHGDLLTLNVKCRGSRNMKYCVKYEQGVYNFTGKENCSIYHELEKCEFPIQRYFLNSTLYTIIIIIENEVSKVVTPVAITVYKVKRQPQLSVIVVPVAFSLAAVVLIVFGVAYYLQNRSRFVIEVADFNFGQNYSDMEYKTFRERLADSISNAFFNRAPSPGSSEVPVWPPGRKYGSMTS